MEEIERGPIRRRVRPRRGATTHGPTWAPHAFADLYFGRAAAENEVAADPERFRRTYFDRWNLPETIANHERFLLLGPKGAGKSAAASYVDLEWRRTLGQHAVMTTNVDFDELNRTQTPLTQLDKKLVSEEVTNLTDSAWKLFIGVRFLERLLSDPASTLSNDPHALRLLKELREAGLASDDYPKVLRQVREKKGTFGFPKYINGEFSRKETESLSPGQLGDAVINLILNARTPTRHLLSIDGLDKAISDNESYWQTLAALIRVVDYIVRRAVAHSARHIYILVMCRSDVFRRVQFTDAPKIAADGGVHLEWHAEAADPKDVLLWDYISRKAEVEREQLLAFLPTSVKVGKAGGIETLKYLLQFTRYTPRDMSLMFIELRNNAMSDGAFTGAKVRLSADRFATQHLLQEIVAEATGLLPKKVVSRLKTLLSSAPRRIINRTQFLAAMDEQGIDQEISPNELGEYLFLQGAIGNFDPSREYVQFYHRRDVYEYRPRGPWVIHSGLVYALNIPW